MTTTAQTLDPERQREAKQLSRMRRRLWLVDLIVAAGYAMAWLSMGFSASVRASLLGITTDPWIVVPLFAALFGGGYWLLNLPLAYYAGFVLPHRYGLSNQTARDWLLDQLKGIGVAAVLGLIVLEALYAALRAFPDTWWLWAAGGYLLLTVVLANLAPVILAPIFFKFVPLGGEHGDLAERLIRLANRAGTRVQGVYEFDMSRRTKAANAALMGLGNTRRIVLGDTLLANFTNDEIETILAHELGHHVHRDIPTGLLLDSLLTFVGLFLVSRFMDWGILRFGFDSVGDVGALPLFLLGMGLFGLATQPVSNAYSRWRERRADAYALEATGKPLAYAESLTRLANQNLADADPEPWVEWFFYSHPALSKRITMAKGWGE